MSPCVGLVVGAILLILIVLHLVGAMSLHNP
jgi:hypothetical protein